MHLWKGLEGLPRSVWMLSLSTLVNRLGTIVMFFLPLYLVEGRGWTEARTATALAVYGFGALAASPFSGILSDRLGHRRTLALSLVASALVLLFIPCTGSPAILLPLVFLWSALNQAFWPASMALITELAAPEQRKQAFVLHRLASNLGISLGPVMGGLIAHYSFTAAFWVDALTTLASVVLLIKVPAGGTRAQGERSAGTGAWRDRRLVFLLLALLPSTMVFTQIHGPLSLWVCQGLGHSKAFFGLIFTFNTVLILLLEVAVNQALIRWSHGRQLALGALLIALGFGLTGLARPVPMLALTVVLWSLGEMVLLPATGDAVARLAPPERSGEYMGLYSLSWTLGMTLGPWLGTLLYTRPGPQYLWPLCGVFAGISALGLLRFRAGR